MESGTVTTPFGRRAMSYGLLANQQKASEIRSGIKRSKWKLFRSICESRSSLGISDRALTVLDALLTFYPGDELCEDGNLIVFPSNAQLSLRARGMAPATLRRHLSMLVETGLILRKDSPNGKRYARRSSGGKLDDAFGFSLAPLLARAREIETMAAEIALSREQLKAAKERITLCRRDLAKLITFAVDEKISGDWEQAQTNLQCVLQAIPRVLTLDIAEPLLTKLSVLREEVVNQLKLNMKSPEMSANESQSERHIQDSKTNIISESEPVSKGLSTERAPEHTLANGTAIEEIDDQRDTRQKRPRLSSITTHKALPLPFVLQACTQINDYGPRGGIASWRDLITAAYVVRSTLDITPAVYERAAIVMGPENAATVLACMLERAEQITSAGGYLRDLTRRAEKGEFATAPMLMALMRGSRSKPETYPSTTSPRQGPTKTAWVC
ncbi:plasmid replication protein RepC [Rhizobium soli]|nr:plasmid replication protein RepC [Rhizobium soli]